MWCRGWRDSVVLEAGLRASCSFIYIRRGLSCPHDILTRALSLMYIFSINYERYMKRAGAHPVR